MFVRAEALYGYEHGSRFRIYDETFDKLLADVSEEDFEVYKIADRLCCEQMMAFVEYEKIDIYKPADRHKLARFISPFAKDDSEACVDELADFLKIVPRLPDDDKQYKNNEQIQIDPAWSRQEVIEYLESIREENITADLAFYAYRDMTRCDWRPFVKAAIERCPVSIEKHTDDSIEQVYSQLTALSNESIYDGTRLAQPDEVVNYNTGDGIEKAFALANILRRRKSDAVIQINVDETNAIVKSDKEYVFTTSKGLKKQIHISPDGIEAD